MKIRPTLITATNTCNFYPEFLTFVRCLSYAAFRSECPAAGRHEAFVMRLPDFNFNQIQKKYKSHLMPLLLPFAAEISGFDVARNKANVGPDDVELLTLIPAPAINARFRRQSMRTDKLVNPDAVTSKVSRIEIPNLWHQCI